MKRSTTPRPRMAWAAVISVTVFLLGFFMLATPQGKVLAQEILNFFTRAEENTQAVPAIDAALEQQQPEELTAPPVEVVDEGCGTAFSPRCSVADIQPEVPFTVQSFAVIPDGMEFKGAAVISDGVVQRYFGEKKGELLLIEKVVQEGEFSTWTVGKDATVESTFIGQNPAEYVQGVWRGLGLENDEIVTWDETVSTRTLRWQADGIDFTLVHYPARGAYGPEGYELDELTQLAEGLQAGADTANLAPPENAMTLEEAEAAAGFEFTESGWLPPGLTLAQTTYDSQHNAICQYYLGYKSDLSSPTLVIAQSTWALPTVEEIQAKAYFGDVQVTIAISEETLPIIGASGEQGKFIETGLQADGMCGGEPTHANRVLMWQQNDRTYAVFAKLDGFAGGGFVTKLEMQHLAEVLTGGTAETEMSGLDPERLLTLQDAEALAGFDIQQPVQMLTNVHFDHIAVSTVWGNPLRAVSVYTAEGAGPGGPNRLGVFQTPNAEQTLDELKMAGGYSDVTIKGNPAIYQAQCSEGAPAGTSCWQIVSWYEGATQFDIESYFPALIPEEIFLGIAESMQ